MSVQVQLEEDDRKFIKEVKSAWSDFKRVALMWCVALVIGFCIGKVYTWDTIITDCKVLGVFRIANTAFQCKMLLPL